MSTINTQGFGILLAPAGFSLEANKVFATLALALEFIQTKPAAYVGSVISVTNDTAENNGIYWVEAIGEGASLKPACDIDLSNYYTIEEVDGLIPEVPVKGITLNGNVQTPDEDGIVKLTLSAEDVDVNLDGYATEDWVKEQGYLTEHQDISNLATKDEIPTTVAQLTDVDNYALKTEIPSIEGLATKEEVDAKQNVITDLETIRTGAAAGSTALQADDLTGYATEAWVENKGYLTEHQSLEDYATKTDLVNAISSVYKYQGSVENYESLPTENLTKGDVYNVEETGDNYAWTGEAWDKLGGTIDLSNYALKTDIPSLEGYATQTWVEGKGYLTAHQDLSDYAKTEDLATVATSGSYNDLSDKPEIPSIEGLAKTTDVESAISTAVTDMATKSWVEEQGYAKTEDLVDSYSKEESDAKYALAGSGELNAIEVINIKTDKNADATPVEIVEKSVTIDLSGIDERLDVLEAVINPGGSDTNITDLIAGKQDKLDNGSADQPHLIWDPTNTKWAPGKIEIPVTPEERLVPETEGVESPAILAFDGTNIIWSSSEVQKELPEYSADNAGLILTVNTEGNVIWQAAPVSTTVTKDNVAEGLTQTYTVAQDENSVTVYDTKDVYTKTEVDNMFTWQNL